MKQTHKLLGVKDSVCGTFGCMKMKDEDHHAIVSFIEDCICKFEPDVVITHHPSDLHNDHYITSICCQEAVRLPLRAIGYNKPIKAVMFMEVKSSTDWHLNNAWRRFEPNYYIPVSEKNVNAKIEALKTYEEVIRPYPYVRSEKALSAKCLVRGSECHSDYAEAFQIIYGVM